MERMKKLLRSPLTTLVLFALAAGLLLTGTIGGARAALTYFTESYVSRVEMTSIGVTLVENGVSVSWRDYDDEAADGSWIESTGALLENLLSDAGDASIKPDKTYVERLAVTNSGGIDEYVRLIIHRYWTRGGEKLRELDPALIDLHFLTDNGWIIDEDANSPERVVLYYVNPLPAGDTTPDATDALTVRGDALKAATTSTESTVIRDGRTYRTVTTTYDYDGVEFVVEAEVDAVQTHNAQDAIRSAWGRAVSINDGILSLD